MQEKWSTDMLNRANLIELGKQLPRESFDEQRKRIAGVVRSSEQESQKVLCPASGPCLDRDIQKKAQEYHLTRAHSAPNLNTAEKDFKAADFHSQGCARSDACNAVRPHRVFAGLPKKKIDAVQKNERLRRK